MEYDLEEQDLEAAVLRILPDAAALRHHLHRFPELSGEEKNTAAHIAALLAPLGLDEIQTGVGGGHGIVATLHGRAGDGPAAALRADMDALPIQEAGGAAYQSCVPGICHACGHDGHTACLWGAAAVLSQMRDRLRGTIKFIFQPAEETTGGAELLCAAGVLDGVDSIFALHGWPGLPIGQIGVRPGPLMASADVFHIIVQGAGGHAAYPHLTVDPIVVGAQIVGGLQTVASRETSPTEPVVVSVTQFHAGTASNVIPGEARLSGTVRCLSRAVRAAMPAALERIVAGVCAAHRATYVFDYQSGPPVVVNDPILTARVQEVGGALFGPDNVILLDAPSLGAEDFAYYLEHVPGVMTRLGVGEDTAPLHTPTYDFGDAALLPGIRLLCGLALRAEDIFSCTGGLLAPGYKRLPFYTHS